MENKRQAIKFSDPGLSLGKLPPQAIDLEEAVLGAIVLEKHAITSVIDILKPEVMYKDAHKTILTAIIDLFHKSEPIDLLTVVSSLRRKGQLEFVGGAHYIADLTTKVNSSANIVYHSRILLEMYVRRETIRIGSESIHNAYEDTTDGFANLEFTEQSLMDISSCVNKRNYEKVNTVFKEAMNQIEERGKNKSGITGIPSGMTDLDRVTSGWQNSDLVIVAARPGMGKTAFIVSAMRNAAVDFDIPVAIFSLEMSSVQLVNRLISAEANLESEKIKRGNLADYEWEQLVHKTARLSEAPIFIDDTPGLSILELRAKSRRLKMQHDIQLIIVDYLQLMTGSGRKGSNREQEIAEISRSLKNIAKELNVPVIALAQLSRSVEQRGGDKRPMLSDLRESGSIEQDADMVSFIYRPEYYGITEDEEGNSTIGKAEIIIAKHRNGSLEDVELNFIGKFTKFSDVSNSYFDKKGVPEDVINNPYSKFPDVQTDFYEPTKDEEAPF